MVIGYAVDIANSRHLYLPAPPCFLAKARTGVTQAQVRLRKCRQFGAYTVQFGIGPFLIGNWLLVIDFKQVCMWKNFSLRTYKRSVFFPIRPQLAQ